MKHSTFSDDRRTPIVDEPFVDPVYETLRAAAITRKIAIASHMLQREQMLEKQASLNSQVAVSDLVMELPPPRIPSRAGRQEAEVSSSSKPPVPPRNPSHREPARAAYQGKLFASSPVGNLQILTIDFIQNDCALVDRTRETSC